MPDRTNAERYDQAIAYIKTIPGGGAGLAQDIIDASAGRKDEFGRRMSLKGGGIALVGTADQHTAVRALVLCELAFFSFPYAPTHGVMNVPNREISDDEIAATKKKFLPKLRATVDAELKEYMLGTDRSLTNLQAATKRVRVPTTENIDLTRIKRSDNTVGGGGAIICYDGVKNWLFASGMVSRKWMINKGKGLNANTTRDVFGAGTVVPSGQWGNIEGGYFWSIEKRVSPDLVDGTTCHWGASLGAGLAVATNNTTSSLCPVTPQNQAGIVKVNFIEKAGDGTTYGIYRFVEICDVLNRSFKYGHVGDTNPTSVDKNIEVKKYNPMTLGGDKLF